MGKEGRDDLMKLIFWYRMDEILTGTLTWFFRALVLALTLQWVSVSSPRNMDRSRPALD